MTGIRRRKRAQSRSWQRATSWQPSWRASLKRFERPIKKPSPPSASLANTPRWVYCPAVSEKHRSWRIHPYSGSMKKLHLFLNHKHKRAALFLRSCDSVLASDKVCFFDAILQTSPECRAHNDNQSLVLYSKSPSNAAPELRCTPLTVQANPHQHFFFLSQYLLIEERQ